MLHEIEASEWLNTPEPLKLSALRGRVVVVTGLHSVFEHHHVMTPEPCVPLCMITDCHSRLPLIVRMKKFYSKEPPREDCRF